MINKILKEKFPYVSKYFETLIKEDIERFPQSIVFEGLDTIGQYMFSMELARILNCEKDKEESCGCINCSWIKSIKHPAVNIVSPINFKDDASKTVISISQAKKITSSLSETSDYHRFFIFCDAKIKTPDAAEAVRIENYKETGFDFPEENWVPSPVTTKIFKAEASNSLLKSIEEPPKRVTFIFLTKNKEDLISTIVSRSNVFKLTGEGLLIKNTGICNEIENLIPNYPNLSIEDAITYASEIESHLKTNEIDIFSFLNDFQNHILNLIKQTGNTALEGHIKLLERAKRRLNSSMGPKVVLESLFLDIFLDTGKN